LVERFASVYGPSGEYLRYNTVFSLVRLLGDPNLFFEVGRVLGILYLPEHLPSIRPMDEHIVGSISLLVKNILLSSPSADKLEKYLEANIFILSQLVIAS
jgi:hypothetical protein